MAAAVITQLEELRALAGKEVGLSDWLVMTQERINAFADATEDHQWIHIDPQRAARDSPYKTTVAHGFLTLSLLSSMVREVVDISAGFNRMINYGLNRVRFPAPVPAGSKIRARVTLESLKKIEGGFQFVWNVLIEVDGSQKPALAAEWVTRAYH